MVEIIIPRPPSINRLWRIGRGRMYRSLEYTQWIYKCEAIIKAAGIKPIKGRYKLMVRAVRPDKRRRDIDNVGAKAVNDMLQHAGIVEDDCLCEATLAKWVKSGPETVVTIIPIGGSDELSRVPETALQTGQEADDAERHPRKETPASAYARIRKSAKGRVGFRKG